MINVKPNRINFNKISKYVLQKTVIQNYNNINETKPKNKYTISQIRRSTSIKPDNKLFYKILESSYYTKCNNLKRPLETQIKNNIVHKSSDAKISKKNPTMNSLNKSEIHSTRNNLNINYSNTSQKNDNKKGSESFSNSTFRPHIKIQKRNNKSTLDHFSSKKNSIDQVLTTEKGIQRILDSYYAVSGSMNEIISSIDAKKIAEEEEKNITEVAEEAPIIKLVNMMFMQAVKDRASDIHIEPRAGFI